VTDAGLKEIAALKELRKLGLAGTKVSDKGFHELAKMTQLESLYLNYTNVTKAGAAEIKKALPKCEISHDIP
jgi:hypothetical protein